MCINIASLRYVRLRTVGLSRRTARACRSARTSSICSKLPRRSWLPWPDELVVHKFHIVVFELFPPTMPASNTLSCKQLDAGKISKQPHDSGTDDVGLPGVLPPPVQYFRSNAFVLPGQPAPETENAELRIGTRVGSPAKG